MVVVIIYVYLLLRNLSRTVVFKVWPPVQQFSKVMEVKGKPG